MQRIFQSRLWGLCLCAAASAQAHHGVSNFDFRQPVALSGTVKEFQWTNPHVWIQLLIIDRNGKSQEWSLEGGGLYQMKRRGWDRNALKPGDKVTMHVYPARDGSSAAALGDVMLADGRVLQGVSAEEAKVFAGSTSGAK